MDGWPRQRPDGRQDGSGHRGTGGIGKATATELVALGARVGHRRARPGQRGAAAAADIEATAATRPSTSSPPTCRPQAEVRQLAEEVLAAYPRLDVLVNNVGGLWARPHAHGRTAWSAPSPSTTSRRSCSRTCCSTASGERPGPHRHRRLRRPGQGRIDFDDLQGERGYSGQRSYSQSKLANIMFTYELARRLEGTGLTATVLHPGVVRTKFGAEDQSGLVVMSRLARPFMKTPAQGAATSIYLASSPEVEGVTGRYFVNSKPKTSTKFSYDPAAGARLWRLSADLVGLPPTA